MKIALYGYGKMGKTIERLALQRGHEIVLKIDAHNSNSISVADIQSADVVIEFSQPEFAKKHIKNCFDAKVPVVVGTTGWYADYKQIKSDCLNQKATLLAATNFSIGVNIFFALNQYLAKIMHSQKDYKANIEEIHHTEKLDAPSGTAISIAEGIIAESPNLDDWTMDKTAQKNKLPILAKRIPNVAGTHEVIYQSTIDEISIKHTAHNRDGFALGAILAAEFIQDKHGIFTMKDVLKI